MQLITHRLVLSSIASGDLQLVHELNSLPETDRYNTMGLPASVDVTEKILKGWIIAGEIEPKIKYTFKLTNKNSTAFIGLCGITIGKPGYSSAEIWYKLHPKEWKNGYATEMVLELLRFCFNDLLLHRVEAGCAVENTASIRVLEKAGFLKEGHTRKKLPIRGDWADNYGFAILEEDYFK